VDPPEGEAPTDGAPPGTDPGTDPGVDPSAGPGSAPTGGDAPTFELGGAQGTDSPGASAGDDEPAATGSEPVAVAPPGVPAAGDSAAAGDGDVGSGLNTSPNESNGCACTLPHEQRHGVGAFLTATLLALLGLRRRPRRPRAGVVRQPAVEACQPRPGS
jgi:hypothetical protein